VQGLSKYYSVRTSRFGTKLKARAVDSISLKVIKGRNLAIVGESGCGKTTIGRMIAGIIEPSQGRVVVEGKDVGVMPRKELARLIQPIFQDPYSALNPQQTVEQILSKPFKVHGIRFERKDIESLLEQVGLVPASKFLDRYPHQLSGGQRQRVLIARAIALKPRIIIADEPFSGLDATLQAQVIQLLKSLQNEYGLTYIIITHDMQVVKEMSSDVMVVYLGKVVEYGETGRVLERPMHPYTLSLLRSYPSGSPDSKEWVDNPSIIGDVPSITDIPSGCRFNPRCPFAVASCRVDEPELIKFEEGHFAACPILYNVKERDDRYA
jgi:peptide/nickel transport system ATP-binding protein